MSITKDSNLTNNSSNNYTSLPTRYRDMYMILETNGSASVALETCGRRDVLHSYTNWRLPMPAKQMFCHLY